MLDCALDDRRCVCSFAWTEFGPTSTKLLDRYRQDVIFYDGVQIRNNFNQPKGCSKLWGQTLAVSTI
jgi:hypothetical protein